MSSLMMDGNRDIVVLDRRTHFILFPDPGALIAGQETVELLQVPAVGFQRLFR